MNSRTYYVGDKQYWSFYAAQDAAKARGDKVIKYTEEDEKGIRASGEVKTGAKNDFISDIKSTW